MKPLIDPCKPIVGMGRDIGSGGDIEMGLVLMPLPDVVSKLDVEIGTEVQEMGISWPCLLLSIPPGPIPSEPILRPITLLLK